MSVRAMIARQVLFPMVAAASRGGFWSQVRARLSEISKTQWCSEEDTRECQLLWLRALVLHAAALVPFYRARFRAAGLEAGDIQSLEDYAALPPLSRQDLREHHDELVAEGWHDRVEPNATGGSSGQPVRFLIDRDEPCRRVAMALRHNQWAGWGVGDPTGVVWGAPRDLAAAPSGAERAIEACLRPQVALNAFEITTERAVAFLRQLRECHAEVLFGYAGSLAELARLAQLAGEAVPTLRTVVSSAEALTPDRRQTIEAWAGCPVFDRYGSRETGLIASQCEDRQGLHIAWEDHFVEIEPAHGAGPGRVLVTKLGSYGMPFLRYEIGDLATWQSGVCACGRHSPRLVMGGCRDTDFLIGADGRKVSGSALTLIIRDLPELGTVQFYQGVQGKVAVRLAGRTSLPGQLEAELRKRVAVYLGPVATEVEYVDGIARAESGKFRFTVCEIAEPPEESPA